MATKMLVSLASSLFIITHAVTLSINNNGFESDFPDCPPNTYWYNSDGTVAGWTLYDPHNIMKEWNVGFINPTKCASCDANHGVSMNDPIYGDSAPEGNALLYIAHIDSEQGNGESGVEQTLSDTLAPHTIYTLTAKVGNPGSNCWTESTESSKGNECYVRTGSTGYIMQLLAGDTVLAQDDNSIYVDDNHWAITTVQYITTSSHNQLGNALKIRLMQKNDASSSGWEVNFDDIVLEATTASPTAQPTAAPTQNPTLHPSSQPTQTPTQQPTHHPTHHPTPPPTKYPTVIPTVIPTTEAPIEKPTMVAIVSPLAPTYRPSPNPGHLDIISTSIEWVKSDPNQHDSNGMNWIEIIRITCVVAFVFSLVMCVIFIGYVIYRKKRGVINANANATPNTGDTKADITRTIDITTSNGEKVKHPDNNTTAAHMNQDELEDSSSSDSMYVAHVTAGPI